ncbi:hypothetical protein, partial [uncultured Marinobacter sp.]|uniref:hypothetical protein n=1 Tax=uncultured Marinobacter sp. TaxID=187379 RepID=UPI0025992B88
MEEEDELSPAPMQTPVARRRYHHQQKQVVRGQNVAAAYERSLERDHETMGLYCFRVDNSSDYKFSDFSLLCKPLQFHDHFTI